MKINPRIGNTIFTFMRYTSNINILNNLYKLLICLSSLLIGDWYLYKSDDLDFSLSVPCQLTKIYSEVPSDIGTLKVYNCHCPAEDDDPNLHYVVNYIDYPENTFHKDSTDWNAQFIISTIDENALNLEGKLDYQSPIQQGQYKGFLARISYKEDSLVCKSKYFVSDSRFYAVQVHSPKKKSTNDYSDRFLNSFKLSNQ